MVLEARKSKIKLLADPASGEDFYWFTDGVFSCVLKWKKGQGRSLGSLCKDTDLILGTPPSWHNYLPEAPPANIVKLQIRVSTYEFEEDTNTEPTQGQY